MDSFFSTGSTIGVFLTALQSVIQSQLVTVLVVASLGTFAFVVLATLIAGIVYGLGFAWAGYERDFADGDEEELQFDEYDLLSVLGTQIGALFNSLAALVGVVFSAAQSFGNTIVSNPLLFIFAILVFVVVIIWDTYHNVLLQAFAETYSCFIAPILRTLFLPLVNAGSLLVSALIPLLNALRQVWASITTLSLFDAIICAGDTTLVILRGVVLSLQTFLLALVDWLRFDAGGGSPLLVGPDFFSAFLQLGAALGQLRTFADCLCEPISDIVLRPFFAPLESEAFATALNATASLPLVFLTQGLLRPLVGTIQNLQDGNVSSFGEVVVRPSFNSTFDTASTALQAYGNLGDQYAQVGLIVLNNVVAEVLSACDDAPPWQNVGRCNEENSGTCNNAGDTCSANFLRPRGCCVVPESVGSPAVCLPARTEAECAQQSGGTGMFALGSQCAEVSTCILEEGRGCCFLNIGVDVNGTESAQLCADDSLPLQCQSGTGQINQFIAGLTCAQASTATSVLCQTQLPLEIIDAQVVAPCGEASECLDGVQTCTCTNCYCRYRADRTPAVLDDQEESVIEALGACNDQTVADPPNSSPSCRVPFPIDVLPPIPGLSTAIVTFAFDVPAVQIPRYLFNLLFTADLWATDLDGYLAFRIDDIVQTYQRGSNALSNLLRFAADYAVSLGDFIADTTDPLQLAPSRHSMFASTAVSERQRLDSVFQTTGDLIREGFEIFARVLRAFADFLERFLNYMIELIRFALDQFVGSIYFTVRTGIEDGVPDPFRYAQITFGDFGPPGNSLEYVCYIPDTGNVDNRKGLFSALVVDQSEILCNARTELLENCRFVFQRALSELNDDLNPLDDVFDGIQVVQVFSQDIANDVQTCVSTENRCVPFIVLSDELAPVPVGTTNLYEQLLRQGTAILGSFDPLIDIFCTDTCEDLQNYFTRLQEPVVAFGVLIADFLIHIVQIFSSAYIACLDVIGASNSLAEFVVDLSELLRQINEGLTGTECLRGLNARDSRILCVLAQGVDAAAILVAESFNLLWRLGQVLVRVIDGSAELTSLVDFITIGTIELPVRTLSFVGFSTLLQVLPRSVECSSFFGTQMRGCCADMNDDDDLFTGNLCLPALNETRCLASNPNNLFALGQTCFTANANNPAFNCATGVNGLPDVTLFPTGCCKLANPDVDVGGSLAFARSCREDTLPRIEIFEDFDSLNMLTCSTDNRTTFFFPNQFCNETTGAGPTQASAQQCPVTDGPAQTVIADALSIVVSDFILLPVRMIVGALQALVDIFVDEDIIDNLQTPLELLVESIFGPPFILLSDSVFELARIFQCAGIVEITDLLTIVGNALDTVFRVGLEILTDLVLFVVYLVVGIIEAITLFSFEVLQLAAETLGDLIAAIAFAVFGSDFMCAFQDDVCELLPVPDTNLNFFVDQCRRVDCCETPPIEPFDNIDDENDPDENSDSSVFFCDLPLSQTSINSCSDVEVCPDGFPPAGNRRKRSATSGTTNNGWPHESLRPESKAQRFITRTMQALADSNNGTDAKHLSPSREFCGAYVATRGYDNVRVAATQDNDTVAQACLDKLHEADDIQPVKVVVDEYMQQTLAKWNDRWQQRTKAVRRHWNRLHSESVQHSDLRAETIEFAIQTLTAHRMGDAAPKPSSAYTKARERAPLRHDMHSLAKRLHNYDTRRSVRKMTRAERKTHIRVKRSVWRAHRNVIVRQALIDAMGAVRVAHHNMNVLEGGAKLRAWLSAHVRQPEPHSPLYSLSRERQWSRTLSKSTSRTHMTVGATSSKFMAMRTAVATSVYHWSRVGDALLKRVRTRIGVGQLITLSSSGDQTTVRRVQHTEPSITRSYQQARSAGSHPMFPHYTNRFGVQQELIDDVIDNRTLSAITDLGCDPAQQSICTNCVILDNLIGQGEQASATLREFYQNNEYGYLSFIESFEEGIQNTLEQPLGNDTYTTQPKRTPFILDRLDNIRWFWQWDYSEFIDIVTNSEPNAGTDPVDTDMFVDQTEMLQEQRAAAVGRPDFDNQVFDLFGVVLRPALNFLERAVALVTGSTSVEVLARLYERYIACDYANALVCNSDLGIGLFDALANVILVIVASTIALSLFLRGASTLVIMLLSVMLVLVSYLATMWIAYGASPLCTLPTLFAIPPPIGGPTGFAPFGVPTCLLRDVNQLVAETLPQCPPTIPVALIRPDAIAEASSTVCSTCGTAPPLQDCATAAGFLNGLDNLFYTTNRLFGEQFNLVFANVVGPVFGSFADVAALYTDAYVESLGEAGVVCNRILLPNLLTAFVLFGLSAGFLAAIIGILGIFIVSVFWLYFITLLAINEMVMQLDKGFVMRTKVEKIKIKTE